MTARTTPVSTIVGNLVFFALATAVACAQWWLLYQDARFIVLAAVTSVAGGAIATLGALYRWPTALVAVASLAAFLVLGVPLAVPSQTIGGVLPSLAGLVELLGGTALGWRQLLTITLPVGAYQALLVPVFLVLLVSSVGGLTVLLRARRARETGVLAPVAVFALAIAFGPDLVDAPRVIALALFAVALVWLVWLRWQARRAAIARLTAVTTVVGGAPSVASRSRAFDARAFVSGALILVLAGAVASVLSVAAPPAGAREVLRSTVVQPFDPRAYANPLSGFRSYLAPAEQDAVLFTISGLPSGARVRLATLDAYDGIVYSVGSGSVDSASGTFARVPYRFDQSRLAGEQVSLDVTVGAYSGVWVPTVGQLETIGFAGPRASSLTDGFYYNDTSGTGADVAGLKAGDSYTLDAVIPTQPTASRISSFSAGPAVVPAPSTLPAALELTLGSYTQGATTPGAKLEAMLAGLARDGYVSHGGVGEVPSRSGHSSDRITTLLTGKRMIGDAEQYAVTASLMAQQLGFPARVVYGFAPKASDGVARVTGSSVSAWIEVDTAQYGWVTLDPTPAVRPIPPAEQEEPTVVSRPPSVVDQPSAEAPSTEQQAAPDSTQSESPAASSWGRILVLVGTVLGWVLLGLGLVASPFVVIIATKWRRRRRRRRGGSPRARISGGWREYEDAVVDHGYDPPPSATRTELAVTVGGSRATVLAAIADRAIFAPYDPDEAEADRVWRAVDELRSSLDDGLTRRQRFAARVSLRSIGQSRLVRFIIRRGGVE